MRFLVTGTAGFIGFHLARRLLDDGHAVTGYDGMTSYYDVRLKEKRHALLSGYDRFTPVIGMLEDKPALDAAVAAAEPEVIVHLAAQAGVRYSIENPRAYVDANLVGSFNILDVAREARVKHLLMASTSSVYGANEEMPFRETDKADQPLSLYAATKKAMEVMAHSYAHIHHVPTTLFRFFTVYGPWGRPDMALFKFVKAIREGKPIDVYGHGRMGRDFTYIDDLVEAIVRLVDAVPTPESRVFADGVVDTLSAVAPHRIVNIAGGQPTPLMDFIRTIEEALGTKAELNLMEMQPGDVPQTFADAGLLQALTGYRPATPVSAGVPAFVDWYRDYHSV